MTIPSYAGLNTALSGLEAAQAAIDTTGQNISNANTPGYSRQKVVLGERDPLNITSLSAVSGQGAQVGLLDVDDRAQRVGGDARVERRGVELGMAEQACAIMRSRLSQGS